MDTAIKTVFIVGPTASGKSTLSMRLALEFDGEIICADSQTIRKGLNIGTAKPSKVDRQKIRHHLVDTIGPYDGYSVSDFKATAEPILNEVSERGKLAIIVGGSGLYIDSIFYDFSFRPQPNNLKLREELAVLSVEDLQRRVVSLGYQLPKNKYNPRHLIRIIESGNDPKKHDEPKPNTLIIGLNPERELLKSSIRARVEQIFNEGIVGEIQELHSIYGMPTRSYDAIAYRIIGEELDAGSPLNINVLKERIVLAEFQYAKRQMSWFKRNKHIHWFDNSSAAYTFILQKLNNQG